MNSTPKHIHMKKLYDTKHQIEMGIHKRFKTVMDLVNHTLKQTEHLPYEDTRLRAAMRFKALVIWEGQDIKRGYDPRENHLLQECIADSFVPPVEVIKETVAVKEVIEPEEDLTEEECEEIRRMIAKGAK